MTTKETVKKEEKEIKEEKSSRYFYAIGRRKTAVAKIKLYVSSSAQNNLLINDRKLEEYFPLSRLRETVKAPLAMAGQEKKFDVVARVLGGGVNAQAEAVRLGVARALVVFDSELKKSLKDKKFLKRDPREVERKKAGLKKARRAPQWAKR